MCCCGSVFDPSSSATALDQWLQRLLANAEQVTGSFVCVWEFPRQHLQQEDTKAKDVHLGGLLSRVASFWCRIAGVARIFCGEVSLEVDCAVV